MIFVFLTIFLFATVIALFIYRFNGRKKIFSFDLVQFIYLFIIAPTIFIWLKSFFFYTVRREISHTLTLSQFFFLDTLLSVVGLFLFGILAIHTITKVFKLEKTKDPFADIYQISEYFHLWWSHVLMYVGGFGLFTLVSLLNLFFPFPNGSVLLERPLLAISGGIFGLVVYFAVWTSDPLQHRRSFMRLMKLCYVFFFLFHVLLYFAITPEFSTQYVLYWFSFFTFLTMVSCVFFLHRSSRALRFRNSLLHEGWGNNEFQFFTSNNSTKKKSKSDRS